VVVGKARLGFEPPDNCVDLTNQTTLLELIRLIRAAYFTVTVDSGPMHIAAAITDRLVSIHTWTDPRRVGPYNPDAWIWKNGELLRVSDVESGGKLRKGRRFKRADVARLAELVLDGAPAQLAAGPVF
jgi:ADP-heptose:LPS heptosyltransferase